MTDKSGRELAIPRSGSQVLNLKAGAPDSSQEVVFAAWQSPAKGIPKRMVIRVDGEITNPADKNAAAGFPCGVVRVRYSSGGYTKEVLVDATGQSALTVWADSIDVKAVWDTRRITRLATYSILPCTGQIVAAAISGCECGDTGIADARYLDVLMADFTTETTENSVHPVPAGARGVRFLNALKASDGTNIPTAQVASYILFFAVNANNGLVESAVDGVSFQSIINVPTTSKILEVIFPSDTLQVIGAPWIEWVLSPMTGSYY